jgi:diacylglycerol kinase (ATP)
MMTDHECHTLLILNPMAAHGQANKNFAKVFAHLKKLQVDFQALYTERPHHAEQLALDACKSGVRQIIAVGGDGTVNEIVNGIMKSGEQVTFGTIPAGTCNDFIRTLLPASGLQQACEAIAGGKTRKLDVAQINDTYFINAAGFGFDITVLESMNKAGKKKNFPSYLKHVMKNIFSYKGARIALDHADGCGEKRALMIAIANGQYYGGGFHIAPGANLYDGKLNLVIINDIHPAKRLGVLVALLAGKHLAMASNEMLAFSELKITTEKPMVYQVEGELYQMEGNLLAIRTWPQGLSCFVAGDEA